MSGYQERPPLVEARDVSVSFPVRGGTFGARQRFVHAVRSVSFAINSRETLGIVGESGSGKTTVGRAMIRRVQITSGQINFRGTNITTITGEPLRQLRQKMQMVFQDPYASLNERMSVLEIIAEPLIVHGVVHGQAEAADRVAELLVLVGLAPDAMHAYPYSFSGGQRQRIGIARAIALSPEFVVADEPVASLDVSIRAQVMGVFKELQDRLGLTYLFISHDLSTVRQVSHNVAVMYFGEIVEYAKADEIFERAMHPYTEALLSAALIPDPEVQKNRKRIVLTGEMPDAVSPPSGCCFHTRCAYAVKGRCDVEAPALRNVVNGHWVACHFAEQRAAINGGSRF